MDYNQTLQYLFFSLPYFSRDGKSAYTKNLDNIYAFCEYLGNPQHDFKTIHVAGTNGKGSVSHSLAAVFQTHGFQTGLYTSPHLIDFRERIRVNGNMTSPEFVVNFVSQHKDFIEKLKPSFFEITVAMAFEFFKQQKIEIAIIEVGLGGRLDSTNIIHPELSVITHIDFDHQDLLGATLGEIAYEKAGIIKPNTPLVIGRKQVETESIFQSKALLEKAPLFYAEDCVETSDFATELVGRHQQENAKTVHAALQILAQEKGYKWEEDKIEKALLNVGKLTGLRGRWEVLKKSSPRVIADTAHNQEGLRIIMQQLLAEKFTQLHIVMGMVNDKQRDKLWPIFPKEAQYYFCKPDILRGLDTEILSLEAASFGLKGKRFPSCRKAYQTALGNANENDLVFVAGSTFVVAEILTNIEHGKA